MFYVFLMQNIIKYEYLRRGNIRVIIFSAKTKEEKLLALLIILKLNKIANKITFI